eukprot:scaffold1348_cov279-Pinguiococcus_pyrenoidosus.AAC.3
MTLSSSTSIQSGRQRRDGVLPPTRRSRSSCAVQTSQPLTSWMFLAWHRAGVPTGGSNQGDPGDCHKVPADGAHPRALRPVGEDPELAEQRGVAAAAGNAGR